MEDDSIELKSASGKLRHKLTCPACGKPLKREEDNSSLVKKFSSLLGGGTYCTCDETVRSQTVAKLYREKIDDHDNSQTQEEETSPPVLPEQFEIQEQIGFGGMGSVYRVLDKSIDEEFAIKVMHEDFAGDKQAVKRFEMEAFNQEGLSHPNIIPVFGQGRTEAGAPYMIMGLSSGRSLADEVKAGRKFTDVEILDILEQAAEALSHAHSKQVVHRDIKPGNIILEEDLENDIINVKVVDFGIAKLAPHLNKGGQESIANLTKTGEFVGTPAYMSPEHCMGLDVDWRSDIYSLGCVAYELFTNRLLFDSDNPVQTIVDHLEKEPDQFSKRSATRDQIEKLVFKCLAKDADNRYQNMEDFLSDIRKLKDGKKLNINLSRLREKKRPSNFIPVMIFLIFLLFSVPGVYFPALSLFNLDKPKAISIIKHRVKVDVDESKEKIYTLKNRAGKAIFTASGANKLVAIRSAIHEIKKKKLVLKDLYIKGANLSGMELSDIQLPGAQFEKTVLTNTNLSGANLNGARFDGCAGRDAQFVGTNLDNAEIVNRSDFRNAVFHSASMNNIHIDNSTLDKAGFSDATLLHAEILNSSFNQVNFIGAQFVTPTKDIAKKKITSFVSVRLKQSSFTGVDLSKVTFKWCTFENTKFSNSDKIIFIENRGSPK